MGPRVSEDELERANGRRAFARLRPGDRVVVDQSQWSRPGRSSSATFVGAKPGFKGDSYAVVVHDGESEEISWYSWQVRLGRREYAVSWGRR